MEKKSAENPARIVVLDGFTENPGDLSWEGLAALGDLTVYDRTDVGDEAEIIRRIGDAQLIFTNKTPLTRGVLEKCPSIRFIGVLATGYNVVDCRSAAQRGIPVSNVPSYGTQAVAQYSIALLLEICHHIGHHSDSVHAGDWAACPDFCYWDYPLIELAGLTMGIIGFGRIGMAEGKIAKALGMRVIAYAPHPKEEGREIAQYVSLDELYAQSDVITLHCSLNADNEGMICASSLAQMKTGVILINNARGQLINEADLAEALNGGKVAAAGLDVVSTEPIRPDNPLLTAKNCIITPHISWASRGCRERIMDCAVRNAKAYLAGHPIHVVNL